MTKTEADMKVVAARLQDIYDDVKAIKRALYVASSGGGLGIVAFGVVLL